MKRSRIVELENFPLSDGGHAIVRRLGRRYSFTRTYNSLETPPDLTQDLDKNGAYSMLLDAIKNDVMEVD